jgi:hypothetical protein
MPQVESSPVKPKILTLDMSLPPLLWKEGQKRKERLVPNVRVYGADWCEDTRHTRQYLDGLGVT